MNQHATRGLRRAIAALVWGIAVPAWCAELEEIVVTAQKREQTLQEIPVAVSAFTGDFIVDSRVGDIRGLVALTPGFSGNTEDGFIDALSIRGIGTNDYGIGGDPSVAVFTDGVWAGRTGGVIMDFYDVERVEVVKGPQATLFGRNAIAGAVSIITKKPVDTFEGSVELGVAEYGEASGTAMLNVPINDKWYLRGNLHGLRNNGYLKNLAGGSDLGRHQDVSGRLALRYAGETLDAVVSATMESRKQDPSVYWDPQLGLPKDRVDTDLGSKGLDESDVFGLTANLSWELGNGLTLHSISGFKTYDFDYLEDYDARPGYINHYAQNNRVDYYSQELRLNFEGERLSGFVGAAGYKEKIDGFFQARANEDDLCNAIGRTDAGDFAGPVTGGCMDPNFQLYWFGDADGDGVPDGAFNPADILAEKAENNYDRITSKGWAVFGDVTWAVTERLDLTVGARYTYDRKSMDIRVDDGGGALGNTFTWEFSTPGFVGDSDHWSKFTPRFAVDFELNEQVSLYANVASGYKSGGFATFGIDVPVIGTDANGDPILDIDANGVASAASVPRGFDPETSISYEVGAKTRLLDDSLQLNISAFTYTYKDLQLLYFDQGSSLVDNLGEAENRGLELDAHWLIGEHLDLFVAGSLMDSEITDAKDMIARGVCTACDGKDMPFAPDTSYAVHLTYRQPAWGGEMFAKSEYSWQGNMYSDLDNIRAIAIRSWGEWNFRAGYDAPEERWGLAVYVENAFNERYFERGWANADTAGEYGYGITNTLVWPSKPRTVGASVSVKF